jgi:mono/diheme cytochrome c family protein
MLQIGRMNADQVRSVTRNLGASFAVIAAMASLSNASGDHLETNSNRSTDSLEEMSPAERGYWLLRNKAYLPADFDQTTFELLWGRWPEPLRSQAAIANRAQRRRMTFSRYGLMDPNAADSLQESTGQLAERVDDIGPLGYVLADDGWVMNCLACHAGRVAGTVIPGLPNSHLALQTLTEDVRATKLLRLKTPGHLDKAALTLPLNTTDGTTNSVVFGIVLGALRLPDMSVDRSRPIPPLVHHDMDAPPFWNVRKKTRLYIDGFAPKAPRPLMQFMLLPENDRETVLGWEQDFEDILAWIESVEAPRYPWKSDATLAKHGEALFVKHCAECHGTYGTDVTYPEVTVPIDVVGTDPLRLTALSPEHRKWMQVGWMSRYGEDAVIVEPVGYVAPPLDGVWASAPYLHNGSVPTLWHVLRPDERPAVWQRTEDGYDRERGGLEITEFAGIPASVETAAERRRYFDTRLPGKSAAGHRFVDVLDEAGKRAVLEYLKTL